MRAHIQLIAWLQMILGSLVTIAGLLWTLFWSKVGTTIYAADFSYQAGSRSLGVQEGGIGEFFRSLAWLAIALVLFTGIPCIISGLALLRLRPHARTLGAVVSVFNILFFINPLGLLLGIYGLVILLNARSAEVFDAPAIS